MIGVPFSPAPATTGPGLGSQLPGRCGLNHWAEVGAGAGAGAGGRSKDSREQRPGAGPAAVLAGWKTRRKTDQTIRLLFPQSHLVLRD